MLLRQKSKLFLIIAFLVALALSPAAYAKDNAKDALSRVVESSTIRCSYAIVPPMIVIDPNTQELSGIFYDLVNEIGKRAGFKVDWVEEVGFGNVNAGFITNRYEAFCAGLWPSANRARNTVFSDALFYAPVTVWGKANVDIFDGNVEKLNNEAYKMAAIDGDATNAFVDANFPKAGRITVTQNQSVAEYMDQVAAGKADAAMSDLMTGRLYIENNPNTIKDLSPGNPVFTFPLTIGFNKGEYEIKTLFDTIIRDIKEDGTVARVVKMHMGNDAGAYYQSKTSYQAFSE